MPIDVVCPKCLSRLRAPDEVVGKSVRCKKCQEKFKVPNPGPPVDSVGDTQQLSVLEMPLPKLAPKPAAPEPMMLDDSAFDEPLPAAVAAAKPAALPVDEEPPRKKKRPRDDEEDDERPRKKKEKMKPVIGGEPTFAMPGAAEDPAPIFVPPPVHASQFSFDAPPPDSKRIADDDDDDRPKKKKKNRDDDDDDPPAPAGKKPAKGNKMLMILGALAAVLLLGCGGAVAAVYFFVIKVADDVSKATITVGTTTKFDGNNTNSRSTKPAGNPAPIPPVPGSPISTLALPPAGESKGPIVGVGTATALPFSPEFVRQVHGFDHPVSGWTMVAVYQSSPGFMGKGAEDAVFRFDPARKIAGEFKVDADGIEGRRILDFSDSGERVAIEAPKGRLTVYDFPTKTKLFDGFDPQLGTEAIAGLAFGDSKGDRVAVVLKNGTVDVWDVNERQRVGKRTAEPGKVSVVVEPRRYGSDKGVIASKGWIKSVNWKTGQVGPAIKLPAKSGAPQFLAAQGQDALGHTAIIHTPDDGTDRELLVVDKVGAAVWRLAIPAAAGDPRTLRWFHYDKEIAVGFEPAKGMVLLDFAEKTVYGYLKPTPDKSVLSETGELYLVPDPKAPGKAAVVTASIDVKPYFALLEAAKAGKVPERLFAKPDGISQ